ncbi:MAG: TraR/DksA family transcriptional regulator [Verrucomicrobia bacterium]|nr:TraR/DksA family transcriptional regulator [Verrucomicrobiota bacterium]MBU4246815.1 TraR/DksA family transcriptional regulator [Verrucomicrobiota bacterium]MBU4291809.1 TraR/DksA family transcriptional regulator [Verrucomicrobiota bacterium]MBU4428234.1 TraR/DksA family transcriptional regulator [Verrucomicrobiota bacterium]MCG2680808.1 TraR/DksA family transcriptional regulator [Kiritimatiellia bacterium]
MVKKKKVAAASKKRLVKKHVPVRAADSQSTARSKGAKVNKMKAGLLLGAPMKIKIPKKHRPIYDALGRLRDRINRQINFLATDNLKRKQDDAEVDFRSEEQGTDNFDRDFALNRVSLDQDIIFEIDEALNRIQMGTYGVCESCGRSIERARMSALPYSRMCVVCQSKSETGRKHHHSFEATALFPNADKVAAEANGDEE